MTVSEELGSYEDDIPAAPNYPSAFGVTFTPTISGIAIAVAGIFGAAYIIATLVMPTWQRNQELTDAQNQKQALVQQKTASLQQKERVEADLARAKQQNSEVLALFANEQTLDTLLLDFNRLVQSANGQNSTSAQLKKFVPANQTAEVISDGSLGSEVNGKLKQRTVEVTFDGTFEQTQSILRNIERLQPLLIIRDYKSTTAAPSTDPKNKSVGGPPTISTTFKLQALIPVSPAQAAQAAQQNQEQKK